MGHEVRTHTRRVNGKTVTVRRHRRKTPPPSRRGTTSSAASSGNASKPVLSSCGNGSSRKPSTRSRAPGRPARRASGSGGRRTAGPGRKATRRKRSRLWRRHKAIGGSARGRRAGRRSGHGARRGVEGTQNWQQWRKRRKRSVIVVLALALAGLLLLAVLLPRATGSSGTGAEGAEPGMASGSAGHSTASPGRTRLGSMRSHGPRPVLHNSGQRRRLAPPSAPSTAPESALAPTLGALAVLVRPLDGPRAHAGLPCPPRLPASPGGAGTWRTASATGRTNVTT